MGVRRFMEDDCAAIMSRDGLDSPLLANVDPLEGPAETGESI